MKLDDIKVSRIIIKRYTEKLLDSLECDVAIVGGGPAGLVAGYYLALAGKNVVLLERTLSVGGGMWGGGIMFNEIVVQEGGKDILDEFDVNTMSVEEGYFSADSVETVSTICSKASKAGLKIFNLLSFEDVMIIDNRVSGLVINWSSVGLANLHVDPVTMRCKYVIDATGHDAEVATIIQKKPGCNLKTDTGEIIGEGPMNADLGERLILENTKEFFPGVFSCGMCCNAIFGGPRMGPIFGGMLMSGKKAAALILGKIVSK